MSSGNNGHHTKVSLHVHILTLSSHLLACIYPIQSLLLVLYTHVDNPKFPEGQWSQSTDQY